MTPPDPILQCDALIQYQGGKWASKPQDQIPRRVIVAALAAYDPAKPLRFNGHKGSLLTKPQCPYCKGHGVRPERRKGALRSWLCQHCWRHFEVEI